MAFHTPLCSCARGRMHEFMARTPKNRGRHFFICPVGGNHAQSFIWVDEYMAGENVIQRHNSSNTTQQIQNCRARAIFWVCCGCNLGLCLVVILLLTVMLVIISLK